jgi:cyanophycinase-like exopeptidase
MRAIIRVLGARETVQALVTSLHPQRRVLLVGAAVDATHSASMILLAAREPRLRRLAAASAAAAALFALVGESSARE